MGILLFHPWVLNRRRTASGERGRSEGWNTVQGSCRLPCFTALPRGVKSSARTAWGARRVKTTRFRVISSGVVGGIDSAECESAPLRSRPRNSAGGRNCRKKRERFRLLRRSGCNNHCCCERSICRVDGRTFSFPCSAGSNRVAFFVKFGRVGTDLICRRTSG